MWRIFDRSIAPAPPQIFVFDSYYIFTRYLCILIVPKHTYFDFYDAQSCLINPPASDIAALPTGTRTFNVIELYCLHGKLIKAIVHQYYQPPSNSITSPFNRPCQAFPEVWRIFTGPSHRHLLKSLFLIAIIFLQDSYIS